jgi:hypothetical protein
MDDERHLVLGLDVAGAVDGPERERVLAGLLDSHDRASTGFAVVEAEVRARDLARIVATSEVDRGCAVVRRQRVRHGSRRGLVVRDGVTVDAATDGEPADLHRGRGVVVLLGVVGGGPREHGHGLGLREARDQQRELTGFDARVEVGERVLRVPGLDFDSGSHRTAL